MYISKEINQKKLLDFVEKFKEIGYLQQFGIIHNNELKLKFSINPYLESDNKQLFSVSKSFTSMAIGKAIDNGLLNIHDKVIKFFPVENPSENLKKMEVFHLITMTTGHDRCVMPLIACPNPVEAFLKLDIPYEPGTKFVYNTGASLILSIIVSMVTGVSVDEYLSDLYQALGIKDHYYESMNGISLGGVGLHLNIDGILAFGKMLLNEGNVDGKQIISKEYIKAATSKQVENDSSTKDWVCGYGYHMWQSTRGYRCDGAYGQFILVIPENDLVICAQAYVSSMQDEIDLIFDLVDNLFGNADVCDLESKINDVYKISKTIDLDLNCDIKFDHNKLNLDGVKISSFDDHIKLEFYGENGFSLEAGNGYYIKNRFMACGIKVKLSDLMPSYYEESIVSSHYIYENNRLEVVMKNHNTPLLQSIVVDFNSENIKINVNNCLIDGKI